MVRLRKGERAIVKRFCEEHNVTRSDVMNLGLLIGLSVEAQTNWHNGDGTEAQMDAACNEVTKKAKAMGFGIRWDDGLYPRLLKGGRDYEPPFVHDV